MKIQICVLAALAGVMGANGADSVRVFGLGGLVGERMKDCYEHGVKAENEKTLVDIFRERKADWDWRSEFWGKWMHSAPVLAAYYGDEAFKSRIAKATAELISTQTPEGYIGNYPPERQCMRRHASWDVWGRKYTMLGLIHQYDYAHDEASLKAAEKILDHLMTQCGSGHTDIDDIGNFRGMPSMSVLEPVMWLYTRTKEKRFLDFATYIVSRMEAGTGLISKRNIDVAVRFPHPDHWWTWVNGGKAYEMMSCYQGLIEYARVTGRRDCLEAAIASGENIATNEITICGSGASNECWYYGSKRQTVPSVDMQEGCVTVTWMRLCEALGHETGEAKWADRFERAFYNAYLGGIKPDGSLLAKYTQLEGRRHPGDHQCGLKTNCCSANGPRGFVEFMNYMAEVRDGALTLNLYAPATVEFSLPCGKGALKVETAWPESGEVALTLVAGSPMDFTVRLREPSAGRYRELRRTWKPGERVSEKFALETKVVEQNGCVAFMRGPVVFARDSRLKDGDIEECVWFEGRQPKLNTVENPPLGRQLLEAEMATGSNHANPEESRRRKISLIDFASAGSTWNHDSHYQVWLRRTFDPKQ